MWEAITAIATLCTGVAIVLTVLLGIRQLRLTGEHLAHLRRATQLEGAMTIFNDLFAPDFRESMRFVLNDLPERMKDPAFREGVERIGLADDTEHKELLILRSFERVGIYVKHGLIDGAIIYDLMLPPIARTWEALADVVRVHRALHGDGFWENFEFLYDEGEAWRRRTQDAAYLKPGYLSKGSEGKPEPA